jgi:hypothetical protein
MAYGRRLGPLKLCVNALSPALLILQSSHWSAGLRPGGMAMVQSRAAVPEGGAPFGIRHNEKCSAFRKEFMQRKSKRLFSVPQR